MKQFFKKQISIFTMMVLLIAFVMPVADATLVLDNIFSDPAIISAGDEVDIVVEFHHDVIQDDEERIGNTDYKFKVELLADDTLTKEYVIIQDGEGDDIHGSIYTGANYNKKFRIKVLQNAPAGNYEFKVTGTWIYKGVPESGSQYVRIKLPVKKEGIIINAANLNTVPSEVRPGDDAVLIRVDVENSGEKNAKALELNLVLPKGLGSTYADNNRKWIGYLSTGERKTVDFYVDVDEFAVPGVYDLSFNIDYMDVDNNPNTKKITLPFNIKSRPYIIVTESVGDGLAGKTSKLYVTVKNVGLESAESVDVRIIKQNSQPFTFDIRSDYVGELEPGEEGVAIFDVNVLSDADIKEHDLKLLIRSKGDSDEGDDNIYTYSRRAKFNVTGTSPNYLGMGGLALGLIAVAGFIIKKKF